MVTENGSCRCSTFVHGADSTGAVNGDCRQWRIELRLRLRLLDKVAAGRSGDCERVPLAAVLDQQICPRGGHARPVSFVVRIALSSPHEMGRLSVPKSQASWSHDMAKAKDGFHI